jgi:hypothetical protein
MPGEADGLEPELGIAGSRTGDSSCVWIVADIIAATIAAVLLLATMRLVRRGERR